MTPFGAPALIGGRLNPPAAYMLGGKRDDYTQSTVLNLAGAQPGWFLVVAAPSEVLGGAGDWSGSTVDPSGLWRIQRKRLAPADLVAGALSCNSYPWVFGVYRRPRSSEVRASGYSVSGPPTLTGFPKDRAYAGLIGVGTTAYGSSSPVPGGAWALRQSARYLVDPGHGKSQIVALSDLLSPDVYTSGAPIGFSDSRGNATYASVLELLNSAGTPIQLPGTALDFSDPANTGLWAVI